MHDVKETVELIKTLNECRLFAAIEEGWWLIVFFAGAILPKVKFNYQLD